MPTRLLASFGMPQGRSGVLRTSCSGLAATSHASFFLIRIFFIQLKKNCHALCSSDVAFLRASVIPLTSQLVLARSLAALFFCGGNKEAAKALLFVRALFLARLPRTPTRLARARVVLTVISVEVSSSGLDREQKYKCACFSSAMIGMVF